MEDNKPIPNIVWSGIFREIGRELASRGNLLQERIIFITIPAIIFLAVFQAFFQALRVLAHSPYLAELPVQVVVGIAALTIGVLLFTAISLSIVKIEEAIWLKAHFDGEKLTVKQSWRMARRLWWAWSNLHYKLFLRYYLWIILGAAALAALWIYFFIFSSVFSAFSPAAAGVCSLLYILAAFAGIIFWFRRTNVTLYYAPFLFLDRYKKDFAFSAQFWRDFFDELSDLNETSTSDGFLNMMRLEVGEDKFEGIALRVAGDLRVGFAKEGGVLPSPNALVEAAIPRAAKEAERYVAEFAQLAARFVLYHFAYKKFHGKEPGMNEYVYSLK